MPCIVTSLIDTPSGAGTWVVGKDKRMKYPKAVMTITELRDMGFPREYLYDAANRPGQTFAVQTKGKGKWFFDTEKFERARLKF